MSARPHRDAHNADSLALLHDIVDELIGLSSDLAPRRQQGLRPELAEHLPAIAAVVGDRVFSVSELLEHAAIPEGEALRAAIIGLVGALNGRRLGKLLRGIEGENIAGLRIERVGSDRLGVAWTLRVCEFETRETRFAHSAALNRRG